MKIRNTDQRKTDKEKENAELQNWNRVFAAIASIIANIVCFMGELYVHRFLVPSNSPYLFALNTALLLFLFISILLFGKEMIWKSNRVMWKIYIDAALQIILFLLMINRYFDSNILLSKFPELSRLNDKNVMIFVIVTVVMILFIFFIVWLIHNSTIEQETMRSEMAKKENADKDKNALEIESIGTEVVKDLPHETKKGSTILTRKKSDAAKSVAPVTDFLNTILVIGGVAASIGLSCYLVFIIELKDDSNEVIEKVSNVVFQVAILSAVLILLVGLLLFIMKIILNIFKSLGKEGKFVFGKYHLYLISIIIYSVAFLSLNQYFPTLENLFNNFVSPDFLAIPLAFLFGLISTVLFIHMTFLILNSLLNTGGLLYLLGEGLVLRILTIVCEVILSIFEFISFIPDYFSTIYGCIESENEDERS